MQSIKSKFAAVLVVVALAPLAALAHQDQAHSNAALGSAAQAAAATRTVAITTGIQGVNVDQGDVVTFEVGGKSFTWQFDTLRPSGSFNLADIAPADVNVDGVRVYVAPNPLYRN